MILLRHIFIICGGIISQIFIIIIYIITVVIIINISTVNIVVITDNLSNINSSIQIKK
jgi:hypothetical protein